MKVTIKNADKKIKELEKAEYHIREAKKILLWAAGEFELEIKGPTTADPKSVDEIGTEIAKRVAESLR